jgi:DNA-binding NarL/FixJ family response regulator
VAEKVDVLIVEDQAVMRAMLREFLQSGFPHHSILQARSGQNALELAREHRPSVVLMDIGLPDANGIEVTAAIKALLPDTRVVMVSQHTEQAYRERAHAAGAFAFVTKEKIHTQLIAVVARALQEAADSGGPGASGGKGPSCGM